MSRGDPDFDGMVVGLGALGVITRVTLDVQPAYEVEQRVYERLSWDAVEQNFEEGAERTGPRRVHVPGTVPGS